jgi:hypothetical protein
MIICCFIIRSPPSLLMDLLKLKVVCHFWEKYTAKVEAEVPGKQTCKQVRPFAREGECRSHKRQTVLD